MTAGRAIIITYHHIADVVANPGPLSVSPRHFAEQLEVLGQSGRPVPLSTLVRQLFTGGVTDRAVAVTFDDGYVDNLVHAKPLLERHDVPATVFVTGSAEDPLWPFWWDTLERVLLNPGKIPDVLELRIDGRHLCWELGHAATYDDSAALRFRGWRAWEDPPTPRHQLYVELRDLLGAMNIQKQRALMAELTEWAGAVEDTPHHLRMTDAELAGLSASSLIDIGGHTRSHPMLSLLSTAAQADEIQDNQHHLATVIGQPVTLFAYPFGSYLAETVGIVREAGFACGCTTGRRPVTPEADPFRLPRYNIDDWSGEEFGRWLEAVWESQ